MEFKKSDKALDRMEYQPMLIVLSALAAAAQAAPAQTAPAAQAAPAAVPAPKDDPIVCRGRSESVVGTRIKPKKICMKKSDWTYIEERTRQELNQINQRGNNPGPALGRSGGE